MPTYLEWDREVLEQCYKYVDAISLQRYFDNCSQSGGDRAKFVALNLNMECQIAAVTAVCDVVGGRKRSPKKFINVIAPIMTNEKGLFPADHRIGHL